MSQHAPPSEPQTLRVAVLQMSSTAQLHDNLEAMARGVAEAATAHGAELVVLPENFAYQGSAAGKRAVAERLDAEGPILTALQACARRHGVGVVAGGLPERSDDADRPFNTSVHVDAGGTLRAAYRKMHLFDVEVGAGERYLESDASRAGDRVVVSAHRGVPLGLSICYDVRFPELYRREPAALWTVPAAFTVPTGEAHWHVLLRARAIENQAFVLAAAQCGVHPDNGRATYGHSLIVDPWGKVLAERPQGVGVASAELDLAAQRALWQRMPVAAHRRL